MADPLPAPADPQRVADWEAFYNNYRKPGYIQGFEITSKLGGGMFGVVFKASRQSIGKDYAIKFLKVDDTDVRRAVLQELEQVRYFAQIDHPNLVSIEDRGEVDGIPYIVMAYAGAETLKDRLPGDVSARADLLRWFLQACRGVAALHERSLVHFDLKPANVFLKSGVARVGDYGLSKLVTRSRGSLSMGRGTPYYMAPEMLQRRGDARSDLYSLGVMLYEIVCGDVPFKGDSEWEVLRKHEHEAPTFPAHVGGRERAAIERCLAKDPAARFPSVHDLIAALGAPASAGAAALQDVGAGYERTAPAGGHAGKVPPVPPPVAPASVDPDAAPKDDPYAGLRKAAREAASHASTIGKQAMANAREIAKRATDQWRASWRAKPWRERVTALRQRWDAHRAERARRRQERELEKQARRERRRRAGRALLASVLVVGTLLASAFLMLTPAQLTPSASTAAASAPRGEAGARVVFGPAPRVDPEWLSAARRSLQEGQQELQRRLVEVQAEIHEKAALSGVAKAAFAIAEEAMRTVHLQAQPAHREALSRFLFAPTYDPQAASALGDQGLPMVRLLAAELGLLPMDSHGDLERARRLHAALRDLTGFTTIELRLTEAQADPMAWATINKNAARLWQVFLAEFAWDERSWQAYRSLHGRK